MTESHDQVFALQHFEYTGCRFFGCVEFGNQSHRRFVRAAMQGAAERTDSAGHG
jgi:hypothetical protein